MENVHGKKKDKVYKKKYKVIIHKHEKNEMGTLAGEKSGIVRETVLIKSFKNDQTAKAWWRRWGKKRYPAGASPELWTYDKPENEYRVD